MKYVKMLGLAVMAMAALMVFVGASTASATVLCKNNLNTAICSEPYAVGTEVTVSLATGTSAEFTNTSREIRDTCTGSTATGKLKSQGSGKPALIEFSTLTWSSCIFLTKTINPGWGELTWIEGTDNGTLVTHETEITIEFGMLGICSYGVGSGTDLGTVVGGNPGSLTINTVINKVSGSIYCAESTNLTAKYAITNPTKAWVSKG